MLEKIPLRTLLILPFIVLTAAALLFSNFITYTSGKNAVKNSMGLLQDRLSSSVIEHITSFVDDISHAVKSNALYLGSLSAEKSGFGQLEKHFFEQAGIYNNVNSLYFGNIEGGLINSGREGREEKRYIIYTENFKAGTFYKYFTDAYGNKLELASVVNNFDASLRTWFLNAKERGAFSFGPVYVLFTGQDMAVSASAPVYSSGVFRGAAAADVFLSRFSSYLESLDTGPSGLIFISEQDGKLVAVSSGAPLFSKSENEPYRRLTAAESEDSLIRHSWKLFSSSINSGAFKTVENLNFKIDGKMRFMKAARLRNDYNLEWLVFTVLAEEDFTSAITEKQRYSILLVFLIITAAFFITFFTAYVIARPLLAINSTARTFADGKYSSRVRTEVSAREVMELAAGFNYMAEKLEITVEEKEKLKDILLCIFNSLHSFIAAVDKNGLIIQWNSYAEKLCSIDSAGAAGKDLLALLPLPEEYLQGIRNSMKAGNAVSKINLSRILKGARVYEEISIYPLKGSIIDGYVIRIDDVSERQKLENAVIQNEKMISVGSMAVGMAHEINNPLAAIIQTVTVLVTRFKPDHPANIDSALKAGFDMEKLQNYLEFRGVSEMLTNIQESAVRASRIVENMLGFARKKENEFVLCDLEKLIDQALALEQMDFSFDADYDFKSINIRKNFHGSLPPVLCEPEKIQQVLLNILRNSADAIREEAAGNPEYGRRKEYFIEVSTYHDTERQKLRIELADNGPGMNDETRERIFEPFYTTKKRGKGTGLGLSISFYIITKGHGWEMSVESVPGQGTRFFIVIPANK